MSNKKNNRYDRVNRTYRKEMTAIWILIGLLGFAYVTTIMFLVSVLC